MSFSFLDLFDISEVEIELINPTSPEKLIEIGRIGGMTSGKTVIDFGCGYAEPLVLWAEAFGISGVGIELRSKVVSRAREKIARSGLSDRLQIIEGPGADYGVKPDTYDFATCIGASFVWENLPAALQALKEAIKPAGRIILGEVYWLKDAVPPELAQSQPAIHTETQLLEMFRQTGLEVEYILHSEHTEWDRYETSNWHGLLRWLQENPDHPDKMDVVKRLHESQDEYIHYGREYFGWALYLLNPIQI